MLRLTGLAAQPNDDIYFRDLTAFWRRHLAGNLHPVEWNVLDMTCIFKVKMAMITRIRIEDRLRAFDRKPTDNAYLGKEVKLPDREDDDRGL